MKLFKGNLLLFFILILGLTLPACKSDSDNGPTGTDNNSYPADQTIFTSPQIAKTIVEPATIGAMAYVDIIQNFTFKPSAPQDTTYYDGAWWHNESSYSEGGSSFSSAILHQFLSGGVVQEQSSGADEMNLKGDIVSTSEQQQLQVTFDLNFSGLNTNQYTINGTGLYDFVLTISPGITTHYYLPYTYNDIVVSNSGGCPLSGTFVVDARPYIATITFNGTTTVPIVITENGTVVDQDTIELFCQ